MFISILKPGSLLSQLLPQPVTTRVVLLEKREQCPLSLSLRTFLSIQFNFFGIPYSFIFAESIMDFPLFYPKSIVSRDSSILLSSPNRQDNRKVVTAGCYQDWVGKFPL